jgi:hypothetical protein
LGEKFRKSDKSVDIARLSPDFPISMEYILFGCNNIGEQFNTLLFKKSGLKRAMSTLLSDFLNFSPKLEKM